MDPLDQATTPREQITKGILKQLSAARREVAAACEAGDYEAAGEAVTDRVSEVRKGLRKLSG